MATILPFPPSRRVELIRRQAGIAVDLSPEAAERHLQRQVDLQRQALLRKGVAAELVSRECAAFDVALRAALWRKAQRPGGAA